MAHESGEGEIKVNLFGSRAASPKLRSVESLERRALFFESVALDLLEALESLLIYGDVYASGADGQSPYGRALAAVARAKGVKE